MAKASSITRSRLMKVSDQLEKRYGRRKPPPFDDFIECLVYQILEVGIGERTAKDAVKRIKSEYVDWNDMRVATIREIQDILGPNFDRCRERAEDLSSLLADLYTAFRSMELDEIVGTPDGIITLRALPDTTLIRVDMVERALLLMLHLPTFPVDEDQFELLRYFGGVPKNTEWEDARDRIPEILDEEEMLRLARGLREHTDYLFRHEIYEWKPIDYTAPRVRRRKGKKSPPILPEIKEEEPEESTTPGGGTAESGEPALGSTSETGSSTAEASAAPAEKGGVEATTGKSSAEARKPAKTEKKAPAKKSTAGKGKAAGKKSAGKTPAKKDGKGAKKKSTAGKKKKIPANKSTAKKKTTKKKGAKKTTGGKKTTSAKKKSAAGGKKKTPKKKATNKKAGKKKTGTKKKQAGTGKKGASKRKAKKKG